MALNFEEITLDRQEDYLTYFDSCLEVSSDYSFVNIWGWAEEYGLVWACSDNLVWIKQTRPETVLWAPVGNREHADWETLLNSHFPEQTVFSRVPESLANILRERSGGRRPVIEDARDHWDYLYSVDELVELKGNRFHKKKNLLSQFKKMYNYEYVPFHSDIVSMALDMQEDWCTWRDCESSESLSAENHSILKILNNWNNLLRLEGGAIMAEGKMVAYTIAERLNDDTIVIHYEKGAPDFKGVYQAVNQMFLENIMQRPLFDTVTTVNREQDLGDEGLRKAKMSYNPNGFIKKYRVTMFP